jgi:putative phosphoesterase
MGKAQPDGRTHEKLIGIISDTHGLVRPEALEALQGSDFIIHAGDIGSEKVLHSLSSIAPVLAVRGNNDRDDWAAKIPVTRVVSIGDLLVYVLHDLKELDRDPIAEGFSAVVCGHSHRPTVKEENGVILINPGSAGPRRFRLPVSVACLRLSHKSLTARLIELAKTASP